METLVTEGQPLLDRGLEEAKKFSEEEVLKWTAATLREDGVKAETIQEAVSMMRKARANGNQLLQQTVKDLVDVFHIPGGPATTLARRVQRLQAEKAARRCRHFVSFFERKACQNIFLFVFVPCMQWIFQALKS